MEDTRELNDIFKERLAQLPKVVRDSITSADAEKHLRDLAATHKLHLDQWTALENEVMLALLGFSKPEDLAANIEKEVGIDATAAAALAGDISKAVFEPIRSELERQLEHPEAKDTQTSMENMRDDVLAAAREPIAPVAAPAPAPADIPAPTPAPSTTPTPAASVAPATPPKPPVEGVPQRGAISESYKAATPSHERKAIDGDPYREQIA